MFEFIEKVIYINLAYRNDRREQIERELRKYFPSEKVQRFNAIRHLKGNIGCTMSHIAVLELAIENKWKNYLVVEDDAVWSQQSSYQILEKLIQKPYDVIQLGSTYTEYDKETYKSSKAWTTTAYIVQEHYYSVLLENFKEGLQKLIETGIGCQFAIDVYMGHLQQKDSWYVVVPSLMIQRPGYSDIEKYVIDNGKYFT
jgi:glycosyl transferase family 25